MSETSSQDDVVEFLQHRAFPGLEVVHIETHASHVFLAGDMAYKMKKAVRFPFLDFSTLEKREAACRHELAINRRTAREWYLGVVPVTEDDGAFSLSGPGETREWLVHMKRFPEGMLFTDILDRGELETHHLDALVESLVELFSRAQIRKIAIAESFAWVVDENIAELRQHSELFGAPEKIETLAERTRKLVSQQGVLLDARGAAGRVRRCHGDLHLGNIAWLNGKAVLFDALEFDDDLATTDVLYDLAFLLMDLDVKVGREAANRLLNGVLDATQDEVGLALLPLYLATRAVIRAKVAGHRSAGGDANAAVEAKRYFEAALPYVAVPKPILLAVGGLSGSGKSTVSQIVAPMLGAAPGARWLRSDVLRKRRFGLAATEALPETAYAPEVSAEVYKDLFERAENALRAGHSVIIDAVHAKEEQRAAVEKLAASVPCAFHGCWLDVPLSVRESRVEARRGDASDADTTVVRAQESYDLGDLSWHRLSAGDAPVVAAEIMRLLQPPA